MKAIVTSNNQEHHLEARVYVIIKYYDKTYVDALAHLDVHKDESEDEDQQNLGFNHDQYHRHQRQ